jgi:hypothetical protein
MKAAAATPTPAKIFSAPPSVTSAGAAVPEVPVDSEDDGEVSSESGASVAVAGPSQCQWSPCLGKSVLSGRKGEIRAPHTVHSQHFRLGWAQVILCLRRDLHPHGRDRDHRLWPSQKPQHRSLQDLRNASDRHVYRGHQYRKEDS